MLKQSIRSIVIIGIFCLMSYAWTLPRDMPRYSQLGPNPTKYNNSSKSQERNNTYVPTTDRLGVQPATTTTTSTTAPVPQFEYALLGQDPKDQHWYRVSLTPMGSKTGYRAQFATRASSPIDAQMAHKHDKTIKELLDFLEKTEEQNLLKIYGQLLASDDGDLEVTKIKRNVDNELEVENKVDDKRKLRIEATRPLLLVGGMPVTATPTETQNNATDSSMVKNFVYFIKGLK